MPHKIGFAVVSSSSHEDNFSATELTVHAPTVSGWRSARLCPYPQHVTLRLAERSCMRRLQLLAHQYMIPSKIEFHVGDVPAGASSHDTPTYFHRLGYVSLSDNEKTGFKARELKSVHVDAVGTYLRLTLHRNYANRYNLYNQVALVAVNVLGDAVDDKETDLLTTKDQLIEHYLNSTRQNMSLEGIYSSKQESVSPLDDLAFDMYQDPEVAQIIRDLDQRKQDSVRKEEYGQAKSLKQAMVDLQKVGERLARFEVEKRSAIEKEDYDTARQKKEQMDQFRQNVYQQLEQLGLFDSVQIQKLSSFCVEETEVPCSPSQGQPCPEAQKEDTRDEPYEPAATDPNPSTLRSTQSLPPPSSGPPEVLDSTVADLPFDERPLPTLSKHPEQEEKQQQQEEKAEEVKEVKEERQEPQAQTEDVPHSLSVSGQPEPLSEKARREAHMAIDVFGDNLVAGAYSRSWSHREEALLAASNKLSEMPIGTPKEEVRGVLRAAVFLIRKALRDPVSSVFQAALKLLKMVLTQFIPKHKLGKAEIAHCLEQAWPNLIARTGDSSGRLRVMVMNFIQEAALFKEVRPLLFIPGELVKPFPSGCPARLALSRVQLLERLLPDLGTGGTGFALDSVMRFSAAALEHSASEVRETALRIVLALYRQHRDAILSFLPPEESSTRRNMIYRKLFDSFAEIDGRPTELQIKALKREGAQKVEKEKKEEILTLQDQLTALKEMSEKEKWRDRSVVKEKNPRPFRGGVRRLHTSSPLHLSNDQFPVNYFDRLCIFCGETDDSFTEDGLDLHYWRHCPMLCRCEHCRQVVEIASLTEHRLAECESRALFVSCPRCGEAVPRGSLAAHAQSQACHPPGPDRRANHCPLCHDNFGSGEEAWKSHLMGRDGCRQNSRRTAALQRAQPPQGKNNVTKMMKHAPSGPKGRPVIGKAPAPKAGPSRTTRRPAPVRR